MTKSVDRYFEYYDACIAAGGILAEFAGSMVDTIVSGGSLETNGAGVVGRWRIEAKQVLRRRRVATANISGNCSEDARRLRESLLQYAGSEYERDRSSGRAPEGENASLFLILTESEGRIPSVRTLRRRLKNR